MTKTGYKIYTIGYQDLSIEQFISTLKANAIDALIDIRENPYSRNKSFSKKNLAASLSDAGIEYHHFKQLGSPPELRRKVKADHDYEHFFEAYEKHLINQSDTLTVIRNLLITNIICLMCYEHDPAICHRQTVARKLSEISNNIIANL